MSLILAIEPDPRQSTQLADLVRRRVHADLVHAETTEGALAALAKVGDRVPDLVLVPSLLSPQEDAAIAGALRIIATAANVRMLTIPMLATAQEPAKSPGVFARLRGRKPRTAPGGCDPDVFADQIVAYLKEAAEERKVAREDLVDQHVDHTPAVVGPPPPPAAPVVEVFAPRVALNVQIENLIVAPPPAPNAPAYHEPLATFAETPVAADPAPHSVVASQPLILPAPIKIEPESPLMEVPHSPDIEPSRDAWPSVIGDVPVQDVPVHEQPIHDVAARGVHVRDAWPHVRGDAMRESPAPESLPIQDAPWIGSVGEVVRAAEDVSSSEPPFVAASDAVAEPIELPVTESPVVESIAAAAVVEVPVEGPTIVAVASVEVVEPVQEAIVDPIVEPAIVEPAIVEPSIVEPSIVEPPVAEVRSAETPVVIEPPAAVDLPATPPVAAAAVVEEPKPRTWRSRFRIKVATPKPVEAQRVETQPVEAQSVEARSVDAHPVEAPGPAHPPVETPPVEALSVEALPVVAPSVVVQPAEAVAAPPDPEPIAVQPPAMAEDDAAPAVVAAIEPPAPTAPEPPALSVPPTPQKSRVSRVRIAKPAPERKRILKIAKPREVDEEIDIDALIAPLLSEIAAKRSADPQGEPQPPARVGEIAPASARVEPPAREVTRPVADTVVAAGSEMPSPIGGTPSEAHVVATPPIADTPAIAREAIPAREVESPHPAPLPPADTDIDPLFFADDAMTVPPPTPAQAERSAWLELVESLRQDIERLKAERAQPVAPPPPVEEEPAPAVARTVSSIRRPAAVQQSKVRKPRRPIEDQWGLFDPEQCGFAALLAKLDEISTRDEVSA